MNANQLLFRLVIATGAALLGAGAAYAAPAAPNILFILADDMGRGDVSAYNPNSAWRTPHIDKLAHAGIIFSDAHSNSAVCSPSRYSILTGRYSWRSTLKQGVGSGFSSPIIEPGRLTVADLLRAHGYATAMIGKWHLGLSWSSSNPAAIARDADPTDGEYSMRPPVKGRSPGEFVDYLKPFREGPFAHGFDSFLGISASLDMPPYVWLRNDRVEAPPTHSIKANKLPAMWRAGPEADDFAHVDVLPRLTSEAVTFLSKQNGRKPFFLYLALTAPHTPIIPTKDFTGSTHTTPYGDFCSQVDAAVGQVLDALAADHLEENTLVIFTADNGCSPSADFPELAKYHHDPQMGLRGEKADIYEGGHRIPFMARWPGHIQAGRMSGEVISQVDFMATCADLLSSPLPANTGEDSYSLLPVLLSPEFRSPLREATVHHSINGSFAIRQGPWKLCLCPDSGGWSDPKPGFAPPGSPPFQLFNLERDPAETTNLYAVNPEMVNRLGMLLKSYVLNGRSKPGPNQQNTGGNSWPQLNWMSQFGN